MAKYGTFEISEAVHVDGQGAHERVVLDLAPGPYEPVSADEYALLVHLCGSEQWTHPDDPKALAHMTALPDLPATG